MKQLVSLIFGKKVKTLIAHLKPKRNTWKIERYSFHLKLTFTFDLTSPTVSGMFSDVLQQFLCGVKLAKNISIITDVTLIRRSRFQTRFSINTKHFSRYN